jgi:hypothetical protein
MLGAIIGVVMRLLMRIEDFLILFKRCNHLAGAKKKTIHRYSD